MDEATIREYRTGTEIIRSSQIALPTFSGTKLPYIFVAELPRYQDRVSVTKSHIDLNAPTVYTRTFEDGIQEFAKVSQNVPPTNGLLFLWGGSIQDSYREE